MYYVLWQRLRQWGWIALSNDFAVLLNCMDGRTQLPAIDWIRDNFHVKYKLSTVKKHVD